MAPSNGSTTPVPHKAVAGVVHDSDPHTFYPFCLVNDFSKPDARYETAELAEADPEMLEHVAQNA